MSRGIRCRLLPPPGRTEEEYQTSLFDASFISEANLPGIYCFIVQVVQYYDLQVFDGSKRGMLQVRDGTYNMNFSCHKLATKAHCRFQQSVKGINLLVINSDLLPKVQVGNFYKISNVHVVESQVDVNFRLMYVNGKDAFPMLMKPSTLITKRKLSIKKARKKLVDKFFDPGVMLYNFVGILKMEPPFDWNSDYMPISKACTVCGTRSNIDSNACKEELCGSKAFFDPEFHIKLTIMSVCCISDLMLTGKEAETFFGVSAETVLTSIRAKEYIKCFIVCLLTVGLEGLQINVKSVEGSGATYSLHVTDTCFRFPSLPDLSRED